MHTPVLKQLYREKIIPDLMKSQGYTNVHQVPTLQKIVINSGIDSQMDKNAIAEVTKEITSITGQRPVITKARKSVSNFKLREGMPTGVKVTMRGALMYEFLYRLIAIALPGIRDFRGISDKLDGSGNYNIGIADHTIFPEVNVDGHKRTIGMDVTIVTSASSDDEGRELLKLFGMPFRKRSN